MAENKLNFETSLKRLEEITKRLEASDTPLEEALALFEEGTGLVRAMTGALDEAEQRVVKLVAAQDGTVHEEPFETA